MKQLVGWLLLFVTSLCSAAEQSVISWVGNAPSWNEQLGVNELRMGCSSSPRTCMQNVHAHAHKEKVGRVTLALGGDPVTAAAHAVEYGELSRNDVILHGIGLDDFLSTFIRWERELGGNAEAVALWNSVIDSAKRNDAGLKIGITLYEDQLHASQITSMPIITRSKIDRVSLYLHYRANGPRYRRYVREARRLFPSAQIIAGIYAYDRIDYLPCAQRSSMLCSPDREMHLFSETLGLQMQMLARGEVDGLELYPGDFGAEEQWRGWDNEEICRAQRRAACIDLTLKMRKVLLGALKR